MSLNLARTFALSVASAGVIGGAAIGMAGTTGAATIQPTVPGHFYSPGVKAHPAPQAMPGWHGHHGAWRIRHFEPGYRP
jgi:hypothetical protein